jgi:hypothetical protein
MSNTKLRQSWPNCSFNATVTNRADNPAPGAARQLKR